jgi:hypothetical protein
MFFSASCSQTSRICVLPVDVRGNVPKIFMSKGKILVFYFLIFSFSDVEIINLKFLLLFRLKSPGNDEEGRTLLPQWDHPEISIFTAQWGNNNNYFMITSHVIYSIDINLSKVKIVPVLN